MKTYYLHFEGSILDEYRSNLPTYAGIYLVYRGVLSSDRNMVICNEIIYIGKSDDIRRRLSSHNKRTEFIQKLETGEILFYSYAKAELADLDRIENALIYHTKPSLNDQSKDAFLYPSTEILSDGQCARLDRHIIIENSQP